MLIEADGETSELITAVRDKEKLTNFHLPIIALTAQGMKAGQGRHLAARVDKAIAKPIDSKDLYAAIDSMGALTAWKEAGNVLG